MATAVPYRFINGLPPEAQHEIERDFAHLQGQIGGSASLYDAIIDPTGTNDSGNHKYQNITQFTVGEAARLIPGNLLVVAVIGHPGTNVVESSAIVLGGPVAFVGGGPALGQPLGSGTRPTIDFNGHAITGVGSTWISFEGIDLTNTGAAITTLVSTGQLALYDSFVNCVSAGVQKISTLCNTILFARNSGFSGNSVHGSIRTFCFDCTQEFALASTSIGGSSQYFVWDGGAFNTGQAGCGVSVGCAYFIDATSDIFTGGTTTSSALAFTLAASSSGYLSVHSVSNHPTLSIAALAGDCKVDGTFSAITVVGNTNSVGRNIRATVAASGSADITGPARADLSLSGGTSASFVKLRGKSVRADVQLMSYTSGSAVPLQLIGCTDSLVAMSYPTGAGSVPYTIDAASARCVVEVAGVTDGWAGGTNAGTNCNVITELGAASGTWGAGGVGATGATGAPGMDGQDGEDGWWGNPGSQGIPGTPGADGAAGAAGRPGMDGQDGEDGFPGSSGQPGAAGSPGSPGAAGGAGPMGMQGEDGATGEDGFPGSTQQGAYALLNSISGFGLFGDGSDGVVTFDGVTTVLGLVPSGNVYTLTRDLYLAGGSALTGSAKLACVGFRVFCSGNLTIGASASVNSNGNNAITTSGGSATPANYYGNGGAGGAGVAGSGAGSAGGAMSTSIGGAGGAGGAASGGPGTGGGAAGGTATAPNVAQGSMPRSVPPAIIGAAGNGAPTYKGGGGGAGGASVLSSNSGGGGGGGGLLLVAALQLVNNGTISANGGTGAAASGAGTGAGGGGGGGGGAVWIIAGPSSFIGTVTASGGTGGAPQGAGKTGAVGSNGTVIQLIL